MDPTQPGEPPPAPADSFHASRAYFCGCGRYHLTVGPVTLNLTESELVLIGRTVHAIASRRPALQARLTAALEEDGRLRRTDAGDDDGGSGSGPCDERCE